MKKRTSRRKKTLQESNNVILCEKLPPQKCDRCGEWKEVVKYIYKNRLWNKVLIEIKSCKECIIEYKESISSLGEKAQAKRELIPILDVMLRVHEGLPMYDVNVKDDANILENN